MVCGRPQRGNIIYHFEANAVVCIYTHIDQIQMIISVAIELGCVWCTDGLILVYFVMEDNGCRGSSLILGVNKNIWVYGVPVRIT
jgi:hypothetical protein